MKQKMFTSPNNRTSMMIFIGLLALWCIGVADSCSSSKSCSHMKAHTHPRAYKVSVTEFGAVGDGLTLNTKAIENAIKHVAVAGSDKGGALLYFPPGLWLTGSFGLISHLTLSFHKDAVLLGSLNSKDWPVIDPLPSYGRGRELPGRRHQSFIYGHNLTDVIITGDNGTINGQGKNWWGWFYNNTLNYTRPHLIEFINSTELLISNLTFIDSPFWNIHPVYCSKVVVKNLTILAPYYSPNTDGIDPDSSNDVCIEDCYISTGDDLVAIKSGWDEYGISFARPSTNIHIYRLSGQTQSSGITIGSEMSGGVSEVYVEGLFVFNTKTAITIRTSPGRGGYIRGVYISNVFIRNVTTAIWLNSEFGEHPDNHFDPKALPLIEKITIKDVKGVSIGVAGLLQGIKRGDFYDICLYNVTLGVTSVPSWNCSYVRGYSGLVSPPLCKPLMEPVLPKHYSDCYHFI